MKKILRAFFTTGAGSIISMMAGIITMKLFALFLGTQGVGLFSVIRQASRSFSTLANFNGSSGIIQGMNATSDDNDRNGYIISCILFMLLFASVVSLGMVFTAPWLAQWLFADASQTLLIYTLAFSVWISVATSIGSALLNGYMAIGRLAIVTAMGGVGLTMAAYPAALLAQLGNQAALVLPLIASALFASSTAWFFLKRSQWFTPLCAQKKTIVSKDLKHFLNIAGSVLLSGLVAVVALLVVRASIVQHEGLEGAGVFAAAWALGIVYITLVLGTFSTYYLPALTRLAKGKDSVFLMDRMLRLSILTLLPLLLIITLEKEWFILILYSKDFFAATDVLRWLLPCGYIQVTNRVFGMQMVANANMRLYLATNLPFHLIFMLIALYLLQHHYPLEWLGAAFFSLVVVRLFILIPLLRWYYDINITPTLFLRWLLGLAILIICSVLTWSGSLGLLSSIGVFIVFMLLTLNILSRQERKKGGLWLRKKIASAT